MQKSGNVVKKREKPVKLKIVGLFFLFLGANPYICLAGSGETTSLHPIKSIKRWPNAFLSDFTIGAASGGAAMLVYTPFGSYFQNRRIQGLPIEWKPSYWLRGARPLVFGQALGIALQMSGNELFLKLLQRKNTDISRGKRTIAATSAGGLAGVVTNFAKLIALHQENKGTSVIKTVQTLAQSKGGVLRGLGTTVLRETIFANFFLNVLKDIKTKTYQTFHNPILASVSSSMLTGAGIAATTQPFAVLNTKLYADKEKQRYKNGLDAASQVWQKRGISGFYKGTGYRSIGIILSLPVLDATRDMLEGIKEKE